MRVLIIGCGYVGLPLGAQLSHQGNEVFGLRRNQAAEVELQSAGIKLLPADITKKEELARLPRDFDWVVNCVASSGGTADDYRNVYLQGTRNLIEWLAPNPPAKFVYTSSTSVYGQTDGSVVDETSPTESQAETARVLVETEKILINAAEKKNFPAVILRVAGIYGPGRGHAFKQFLRGEAHLDGKGDRILNMIHRDDVVGAIIAALKYSDTGEIYNAADDEPVSQLEFFEWLAKSLNKPLPISISDSLRKRGATNRKISNRKLKSRLDYTFRFPTFREGYDTNLQ